ncbi:CocE/NonD family hydrolase [Blastococcus saxobsidens]|uniref:CocE/NonD family hydrolase n=1 Tax=Blastococcus saxobsidens TaxID=138336 RepID=A0A6L9W045_9ACTN|nr:CocE/NonD family hydrolase [Blastococcus saxobsidens]
MHPTDVDLLFRAPRSTPESRAGRPPEYRREHRPGMVIERDIAVRVGGSGEHVYVDVYRPDTDVPAAPLVSWSPYGKHNPAPIGVIYPASGVQPEHTGELTTFEAPDPEYWVPHGYAIVLADIPGTWYSEGRATYCSPQEARAFADLIEWAGTQPWSAGKVGLSGVSYLTVSQWRVAELNPPHLAAINPWEGWSDTYREVARHGGIPETSFWPYIWERWGASATEIEDLEAETAAHPFYDSFWESKSARLEEIRVPAFVVASWADQGLHTRGTLEGFRRISSAQKWLDVHGRKKWAYYYEPEQVERQRAFFDHFLLGRDTGIESWPRVRAEVRTGFDRGVHRTAEQWPLEDVEYRTLHLRAGDASMGWDPAQDEEVAEYDGLGSGLGPRRATFEMRFDEPVDLVGHITAQLHVSTSAGEDMDVFVALFKLDAEGRQVGFPYYAQFEDGPVAVGWQRASRRERDEERSTPYLPVLAHRRDLPMTPDEVVHLDIEVWPSGTRFEAGERLLLVVQGSDVLRYPEPLTYARHEDAVNRGTHRVHTGGRYDSSLLVPVLPAAGGSGSA